MWCISVSSLHWSWIASTQPDAFIALKTRERFAFCYLYKLKDRKSAHTVFHYRDEFLSGKLTGCAWDCEDGHCRNCMMTKVILQQIISYFTSTVAGRGWQCYSVCGRAKQLVVGDLHIPRSTFLWAKGTCPCAFFSGSSPSEYSIYVSQVLFRLVQSMWGLSYWVSKAYLKEQKALDGWMWSWLHAAETNMPSPCWPNGLPRPKQLLLRFI